MSEVVPGPSTCAASSSVIEPGESPERAVKNSVDDMALEEEIKARATQGAPALLVHHWERLCSQGESIGRSAVQCVQGAAKAGMLSLSSIDLSGAVSACGRLPQLGQPPPTPTAQLSSTSSTPISDPAFDPAAAAAPKASGPSKAAPPSKPRQLKRQITQDALMMQDEYQSELRLLLQYCKGAHDFFREPAHIQTFDDTLRVIADQLPRTLVEAQDDKGNTLLHNALLNAAKVDSKSPPRHVASKGAGVEYYVIRQLASACKQTSADTANDLKRSGAGAADVEEALQRWKRVCNDQELSAQGLLRSLADTYRMKLKYGSSQVAAETPATPATIRAPHISRTHTPFVGSDRKEAVYRG